MSTAKHTPGPWQACELGAYGDFDGKCRVILGDDTRIAIVLGTREEDAANASGIACLPELIDGFRRLLNYADGMHRAAEHLNGNTVDYVTFPEFRDLLAKATGSAS